MKAVAINGSPRRNKNTSQPLEKALEGAASAGAETKMIHLYAQDFKGCISCFLCKRKGAEPCKCYFRDNLSPILEEAMEADVLFMGSPIYFNDVTGEIRCFTERLLFPAITYDGYEKPLFQGHMNAAYFFTMNAGGKYLDMYRPLMETNAGFLRLFNGRVEYYAATETQQFDDYSRYQTAAIDADYRYKRHETQFPKDLEEAFKIGKELTEEAKQYKQD